jgi:NDP-sugar pyrophosphorylase family protein
MILAAGLGTRLRPLTDRAPKALVEVGGVAMLEHVARRLVSAGADRLVINTHHFAAQVEAYVTERDGFGVEVVFSREAGVPLETGGGLLNAARLLRRDAPFFLHNADVLSDFDLRSMYDAHSRTGALATLAVMERESTRKLLFDEYGLLGRVDTGKGIELRVRAPAGEERRLAFAGVHVISPAFVAQLTEQGAFSILDPYLRLAAEGARIDAFRIDSAQWFDIGKPAQLEAARRWLQAEAMP